MEQQNKNFKIVSNKKTRVILPNMFTLVGVCIGLSSIKFALDENFTLSIIAIIIAIIDKVKFSSKANLIELRPIHTPTRVNIFGKITLVFLLLTILKFLFCCSIYYFFAIKVSPAIVF